MPVIVGGVEQDASRIVGASGPGYGVFAVTPDDDVDLATPARSLYITVGGTLSGVGFDGVAFGPVTVPNNFVWPAGALRVKATGTTCTGIWGYK